MTNQAFERAVVVLSCAVASLLIAINSSPASAVYSTSGRLNARIQSPFTQVDRTQNTGTENSDAVYFDGDYNSELVADYIVSLPQGRMGSYVEAVSGDLPPGGALYYTWSHGLIEATFVERIDFTVPAGSYPDGLTVYLYATIRGGLASFGSESPLPAADARLVFQYYLPWDQAVVMRDYGPLDSSTTEVDANESLALEITLLFPGTNLSQETTFASTINTSLDASARIPSYTTAAGRATAELELQVFGITTSDPNVTWTSESGEFLPEPSFGLMISLGAVGLAGCASRRRTGSSSPGRSRVAAPAA